MSREYGAVDGRLAHHFRDALRGVVELQLDGDALGVAYFDLLGGFPSIAGLTPGELVELMDAGADANLEGE